MNRSELFFGFPSGQEFVRGRKCFTNTVSFEVTPIGTNSTEAMRIGLHANYNTVTSRVADGVTLFAKSLCPANATAQLGDGINARNLVQATAVHTGGVLLLNGGNISGGTMSFTGNCVISRIYSLGTHTGNLTVSSAGTIETGGAGGQPTSGSSAASLVFAGATEVAIRTSINGTGVGDLSAMFGSGGVNLSYAAFAIGAMGIKRAASGTHALFAQQVIKPLTVTVNGTSVITNTASLYIEAASAATVVDTNYALWSDAGANRFDGITCIGTSAAPVTSAYLTLGAGTTGISSLRVLAGVAPASPVDGDIWFDGTDMKMQIGGVTKTFTMT